MTEFALTLNQLSEMLRGPNAPETMSFAEKSNCYLTSMNEYLLNENMMRYADYVGLQVTPVTSLLTGELSEAIEWREDLSCGP